MSIIHDALKKVQQSMQNHKDEDSQKSSDSTIQRPSSRKSEPDPERVEVLASPGEASDRKKQAGSWLMGLVAVIVIGASLLYLFSYIRSNYPQLLSGFTSAAKPQSVPAPAAPAVPVAAAKPSSPHAISSSADSLKEALKPMKVVNPLKYLSVYQEKKPVTKPLAQVTLPATPDASGNSEPSESIVINVQGIMADAKRNMAIINGEVHEEGSTIHGVKIVKIELDGIVIEHNGQEQTIKVRK